MSDLWNSSTGRAAVREAVYDKIRQRMSRFFGRRTGIEFSKWVESGNTIFNFEDVLGQLNTLHDPEILNWFELLTRIGQSPVTFNNLDLYVNNVTGDDDTGLGTTASPFATGNAALESLKNTRIDHRVRVIYQHTAAVGQTVYTEDQLTLMHTINQAETQIGTVNGHLSIIGQGTEIETKTAQTLTGVVANGAGGTEYQVGGAPWIADDWIGEFMQCVGGNFDGNAIAVHNNTTGSLFTRVYADEPSVPDEIRGIIPPVRIELNRLLVATKCSNPVVATFRGSPVAFSNLYFDFTGTNKSESVVEISSTRQQVRTDFVVFEFADGNSADILIENTILNGYDPLDTALQSNTQSGVSNIGERDNTQPGLAVRRATKQLRVATMINAKNSEVAAVSIPEGWFGDGGYLKLVQCTFDRFTSSNLFSNFEGSASIISGIGDYGLNLNNMTAVVDLLWFQAQTLCIDAANSKIIIGSNNQNDPLTTDYALKCRENCDVGTGGLLANFNGVLGDIVFTAPNPDVVSAWPAAGSLVGDSVGGAGVHSSKVVQAG